MMKNNDHEIASVVWSYYDAEIVRLQTAIIAERTKTIELHAEIVQLRAALDKIRDDLGGPEPLVTIAWLTAHQTLGPKRATADGE